MTAQELIEYKVNQKTPEDREKFMEIYNKSGLSAYDFCFIFPNNMLKRYGVPLRRGGKKAKRIARKRLVNNLFNPISDIVSREIVKTWDNIAFYQRYADTNDFTFRRMFHDEKWVY